VNLQRLGPAPLAEILLQLADLPNIDLLADPSVSPGWKSACASTSRNRTCAIR
jgi:hypothetical protein